MIITIKTQCHAKFSLKPLWGKVDDETKNNKLKIPTFLKRLLVVKGGPCPPESPDAMISGCLKTSSAGIVMYLEGFIGFWSIFL